MTGMYATHSNLKRPEACLGGAETVQAQLYCATPDGFGHPFPITPFEANLPIDLFFPGTRITDLLVEAQAAAVEFADTTTAKDYIKSIKSLQIMGIAASQNCHYMTDGFLHGTERVIRPAIFSDGPNESVQGKEYKHNPDAPWMGFYSTVEGNRQIMLGTMPLTHQETEDMAIELAAPAFLRHRPALFGHKRSDISYYMGAHVMRTPADGGVDHKVFEEIIERKMLVGRTLAELLCYNRVGVVD